MGARRPWLIADPAPSAFPERFWPRPGPADEVVGAIFDRLRPATRQARATDRRILRHCLRLQRRMASLDDDELRLEAQALRPALLVQGFTTRNVAQVFALVREACFRTLGFRHHPVQILGGVQILRGRIAEMATGEGKTVTAALAAASVALAGRQVHVITVNDYLSARDCQELKPLYAQLGLSCDHVPAEGPEPARKSGWQAMIVHLTAQTLVFDYMRSRIQRDGPDRRLRRDFARISGGRAVDRLTPEALAFCIVDEVDSVLIDEAQTPLIIAAPGKGHSEQDCRLALGVAADLVEGRHWTRESGGRTLRLTPLGEALAQEAVAGRPGLWRVPSARNELVVQAVSALHLYLRDRDYIVTEDKVQIVDAFTGRILADRQWQAGLHQMIEVKENLEPGASRETLAEITFQAFFRRYLWFGGMTGTAVEVARELRAVYGRPVVRIPPNRRVRRRNAGTRLWGSGARRDRAVARRAVRLAARGRPVLIGTPSVAASETVSEALSTMGAAHEVLNARQDAEEAAIIARAGEAGHITVATNMAGRGTDIGLSPKARKAGGLHVILTCFHESTRIDRQFHGRSARQGEPGWQEVMAALDDEVFIRHAPGLRRVFRTLSLGYQGRLSAIIAKLLRRVAQGHAEAAGRRQRAALLRRATSTEDALAFTRRPI